MRGPRTIWSAPKRPVETRVTHEVTLVASISNVRRLIAAVSVSGPVCAACRACKALVAAGIDRLVARDGGLCCSAAALNSDLLHGGAVPGKVMRFPAGRRLGQCCLHIAVNRPERGVRWVAERTSVVRPLPDGQQPVEALFPPSAEWGKVEKLWSARRPYPGRWAVPADTRPEPRHGRRRRNERLAATISCAASWPCGRLQSRRRTPPRVMSRWVVSNESGGDGRLQALVRVRDHQPGAAQAAPREAAQEFDPERLGLAVPDRHAEHLAPAVGVDADRCRPKSRSMPSAIASLDSERQSDPASTKASRTKSASAGSVIGASAPYASRPASACGRARRRRAEQRRSAPADP